jgi:hypothetical protein
MVENVQGQLRAAGYYQVGAIDGSLTPKGKTEDAILAFRNKTGLPLTPTIDDEFLAALAKATPPEVSEQRAGATAAVLRDQGSETIGFTDKVKGWARKLFGAGSGVGSAGLLAVFAGVGLLIWHVADTIEKKRIADYRIGKNP